MTSASRTLSAVDTAWLHMEDPDQSDDGHDNGAARRQPGLRTGSSHHRSAPLDHRPLSHARVESRLPVGLPYWDLDPNFDYDNHIHRVALPTPGDIKALQSLLGDLASTPLDFSKPLWHMHLIENVMGGSALAMRFHHAIADGTAMMWVLGRLMDTTADAALELDEPEVQRESQSWYPGRRLLKSARSAYGLSRRVAGTVLHEGVESLLHPSHLRELTGTATEAANIAARALIMTPDPHTVFKGRLGVQKRVAWSDPVALDDVKTIGRATDAKVNDVLVAAVAGALRHYLLEQGQPVDGIEVRAVVPVNLRSPHRALELGNVFGLVFLSLPIWIVDPAERLTAIKERMDAIKDTTEALVFLGLVNVFGSTPQQVEEQIVNIFGTKATAVLTNVPGPQYPLYFAGQHVRNAMFWVPQSGRLGIGISIFSYDGHVTLGVITDAGLVPDPERITDRFGAEFNYAGSLFAMTASHSRRKHPSTHRPARFLCSSPPAMTIQALALCW